MEGTRHERIALVIAAYVIGFITAFIAFGVGNVSQTDIDSTGVVKNATAQQIQSERKKTSVGIGEDGLFVITAQGERMLSANMQSLGANIIASANGEPGFYFSIIDAEASPNGTYVYFCEQLTEKSEVCDPYIYSLQSDTIYPVKVDGDRYEASIADHNSAWMDESTLVLNGATSLDQMKPWVLTKGVTETSSEEAIFVQ